MKLIIWTSWNLLRHEPNTFFWAKQIDTTFWFSSSPIGSICCNMEISILSDYKFLSRFDSDERNNDASPFYETDSAELGRRVSLNFRPHCWNKVRTARLCPSRFHSNVAEDSAWTWWFGIWVSDVRLEATLYLKKEMNGRTMGRFDDRKVCRWWDFQATLGKTILLSDIAGTALSTTRLVDWLLLMLLNPLVGFHRGRTMCFRAPDQKNQASGLSLGRGRQKRIVSQYNKLDWKFCSGSDIDFTWITNVRNTTSAYFPSLLI